MGSLVQPQVFFVGETVIDAEGVSDYLEASGNGDFIYSMNEAGAAGLTDAEILCSLFAKLCYASLTLGKNKNLSRVRDIPDNLRSIIDSAHGSVFEHVSFNFVATNVSRVFTHELVRHRVGAAYSQTSGRYVRGDEVNLVFDPILEPVRMQVEQAVKQVEDLYNQMVKKLKLDEMQDFDKKKKLTSALRRILPNGQSNEIAFTMNLRTLRHTIMVRTSRHSEWEIRKVFEKVYLLLKDRYKHFFSDAKEREVDGIMEVYGMRLQPYEAKLGE